MEILMKIQKANDYNLKKSDNMNNKLFLVCPFSCMENVIIQKYGDDVFFITGIAAGLQLNEEGYAAVIKDFISRENITEVFIVNDTSCRFINNVLNNENSFGTHSETVIQNLFDENFYSLLKGKTLNEQQVILAELNIKRQAKEMMKPDLFLNQITKGKICIKGLINEMFILKLNGKGIQYFLFVIFSYWEL